MRPVGPVIQFDFTLEQRLHVGHLATHRVDREARLTCKTTLKPRPPPD